MTTPSMSFRLEIISGFSSERIFRMTANIPRIQPPPIRPNARRAAEEIIATGKILNVHCTFN